ncbi:MAG TPA: SPOR domain-containing protein [Pseudolabrys sp.]|nr:SPOR domain-containing protein [Pseudolabrys sp.]
MADDTNTQRSFRSNPYNRGASSANVDAAANDPLAELARLIGQNDPFAEYGQRRTPAAVQSREAVQPDHRPQVQQHGQAAQPQHYADPNAVGGSNDDEAGPYYDDEMQPPPDDYPEDYYAHESSSRRRLGILAIAGIFALGVIGTAGAFGYRALFGPGGSPMPPPVIKADTTPSKIVPQKDADRKAGGKIIYDRVGDRAQSEKLVSREETPVDIKSASPAIVPPGGAGANGAEALQTASGDSSFTEPKKIHTIVIRPDQPDMGLPASTAAASAAAAAPAPMPAPATPRVAAPPESRVADAEPRHPVSEPPSSRHAATPHHAEQPVAHRVAAASHDTPLSLSPGGNASMAEARQPMRVANAPAAANVKSHGSTSAAHGAFVQVSSQRSEADAQASFRSLQGKYPKQLGGRQVVIHRADLGAKGIYYRAMVGPFASAGDAAQLCSSLKAAGGSCLIQRN